MKTLTPTSNRYSASVVFLLALLLTGLAVVVPSLYHGESLSVRDFVAAAVVTCLVILADRIFGHSDRFLWMIASALLLAVIVIQFGFVALPAELVWAATYLGVCTFALGIGVTARTERGLALEIEIGRRTVAATSGTSTK